MTREEALKQCQATSAELAQGAREHYARISSESCDWCSLIPQAIDAWEREQTTAPCACVNPQRVADIVEGMSALDNPVARAFTVYALVRKLRDLKGCACGGREPISEFYAAWARDEEGNREIYLPPSIDANVMDNQDSTAIPVRVIILPGGEE